MKISLIGINSKFIHTNIAIRHIKANCDFPTSIYEFTIKDNPHDIIKSIISMNSDVIGFSCYIWNINIIKNVAEEIKRTKPQITIVFGGPEVSYEYEDYLYKGIADFIIINEGEIAFNLLINSLKNNLSLLDVPNLAFIQKKEIKKTSTHQIQDLTSLKNPYRFNEDIPHIKNKIQYIELSRGCPFHCSYCLASLDKPVRFLPLYQVLDDIDYLVTHGAKTIKFLDRSFNANPIIALEFFKALIDKNYSSTVFQFEINADTLKDEVIALLKESLKPNYFRFEIGVQSTNDSVNKAIHRIQNTEKLIRNVNNLKQTNIDLHLDLIAGLPYEDYNSFKKTFNQIFLLFNKELQLGFLKMLKGTIIRDESYKYDYSYNLSPPYEVISNRFISERELNEIQKVETMLEIYWNKGFFKNTIKLLTERTEQPFDFFLQLCNFYELEDLSTKRYQLYDIFYNLMNYLKKNHRLSDEVFDSLKFDYLTYHNIKPKLFWENKIHKNNILRNFHTKIPDYKIDILFKYSLVCEYKRGYLIVLYLPEKKKYFYYNIDEAENV